MSADEYLTSHPNDPARCPRCSNPWCVICYECDCPLDPYHRWNCALTPIWAQTIRDLDTNPWTAWPRALRIRVNRGFEWRGELGRYCGRGPCAMFDGHDGKCRM